MRQEDDTTNLGTHFSDVWRNAQISRNVVVGALVRNAWRRLFGSVARKDDFPIGTPRQHPGT